MINGGIDQDQRSTSKHGCHGNLVFLCPDWRAQYEGKKPLIKTSLRLHCTDWEQAMKGARLQPKALQVNDWFVFMSFPSAALLKCVFVYMSMF